MRVKVYGYKNCSTCRKATGFLKARGLAFEEVDITAVPPSRDELSVMLAAVGDVRKLCNTSGQVYREMRLGEKLRTMTPAAALVLLASNGRLVKRPLLVVDGRPVAIGFSEEAWNRVLR